MKTALILENNRVRLSPLTLENYTELLAIAAQKGLVRYSPANVETAQGFKDYVTTALQQKAQQTSIPFIVYDKLKNAYAGTTRFMHINPKHSVLHIGATWIGTEFHGSGLNENMKFLMLNCAFDEMGFEKVEFRIDERNQKSRRAVEKLGGVLEGTLRKDVLLADGYKRNTCCYGILKDEWAINKKQLILRL